MPIEFFQVTAAYSNAMLVAVMPHFADFAKKLDLPTPQPVTIAQVRKFNCFNRSDHIGGRVYLTNGCEFMFDHGHVTDFVSPRSYSYLQNPDLVPKFYGPVKISESQAIKVARDAIKKLGYTDAVFSSDQQPEVRPPRKDHEHYIARYRILWHDVTRGDPKHFSVSAEFEVDATTGQLVMVLIDNPNAYRPDLKLSVTPQVIRELPQGGTPVGPGRKITPVSSASAQAFLKLILPQISDYVRRGHLPIKTPVSMAEVDMGRYLQKYSCGIYDDDPMAQIDLKDGTRFIYRHGQVIAYFAHNAVNHPERKPPMTYPGIDQEQAKFFGPVNMTTNQAIDLIRKTIRELGYSEEALHIDKSPKVNGPDWWGTNRIARCFIEWRAYINGPAWVNAEVDVAAKTVTRLYINDHANTNIWREPPKVTWEKTE